LEENSINNSILRKMARFQISKNKKTGERRGFIIIPISTWERKGWIQGTRLDIIEGIDGTLMIREQRK
jgi:hypothetical protein